MNTIDTISDLLSLSGSQYRIFDIGRRIDKISKELFSKIEHNQVPYPYPSQGHAFLAITFWQSKSNAPYLWFVKLPLDERGLLNQGARNHFIAIIVEALGSDLSVSPTEQQEELLKANPYHFTPAQYKLASLNSKISYELKQTPSSFYQSAAEYLSGNLGWDTWHNVGVQGLADIASRIEQKSHQEILASSIAKIPSPVLQPLCLALENEVLSEQIITALITRHQQSSNNSSDEEKSSTEHYILRAFSSSCDHPYVSKYLSSIIYNAQQEESTVVETEKAEIEMSEEVVILLSGRCWQLFADQTLLMAFLEAINKHHDVDLFAGIFKDLVSVPQLRPIVFACMRDPERSNALSTTIGNLFHSKRQSH